MDWKSGIAFAAVASILLLSPGGAFLTGFQSGTDLRRALDMRAFGTLVVVIFVAFAAHLAANVVLGAQWARDFGARPVLPISTHGMVWREPKGLIVLEAGPYGSVRESVFPTHLFSFGLGWLFVYLSVTSGLNRPGFAGGRFN